MRGAAVSNGGTSSVKKIIQRTVVIHPAFTRKMSVLSIKKNRIVIMLLKFDQGEAITRRQCSQSPVVGLTRRKRHTALIVKVSIQGHTEQKRSRENLGQDTQEQL